MIRDDVNHLMMIEPTVAPTAPIVDDLTRRAAFVLATAESGKRRYRGWHQCTGSGCHAMSDNTDHLVGGMTTNSLLVHYVTCHRDEIPPTEFIRLREAIVAHGGQGVEPTQEQLTGVRAEIGRRGVRR